MIYLCKPCGLINTACGTACTGLRQGCGESCKALGNGCTMVMGSCSFITKFPLGGYVMATWITMALVVAASATTLGAITSHGSSTNSTSSSSMTDDCTTARNFCFVNFALGVIHAIAARYMQWRIVNKITEDMGGESLSGKDIPHNNIADAAYHIFLMDIGFCLYFFAFIGSFFFNCWGIGSLGDCEKSTKDHAAGMVSTGPGWMAAGGMIMFGMGAWSYFFCWFCMQKCCGAAKGGKGAQGQAGDVQPQQYGADQS